MRWASLLLLCACDAGAPRESATPTPVAPVKIDTPTPADAALAPTPPTAPAPPNPVTYVIPAHAIKDLTGCWRLDTYERWTFQPKDKTGLVVVRELKDATYADRARIPRPVSYDPTTNTFGFGAAGRIHGLMMLFQLDHSTLKASVFTSHRRGEYHSTGNNPTLRRC